MAPRIAPGLVGERTSQESFRRAHAGPVATLCAIVRRRARRRGEDRRPRRTPPCARRRRAQACVADLRSAAPGLDPVLDHLGAAVARGHAGDLAEHSRVRPVPVCPQITSALICARARESFLSPTRETTSSATARAPAQAGPAGWRACEGPARSLSPQRRRCRQTGPFASVGAFCDAERGGKTEVCRWVSGADTAAAMASASA